MLKKLLGFSAGLLASLVVFAATPTLQADHPDTYVVQKGDTLWDISAKFLQEPWLWPEIWRANPQVVNPHLIYPGDVLNLSYAGAGGTAEGAKGDGFYVKLTPGVRESDLDPIPPVPLHAIKSFLKDYRVMDADQLEEAPYVVAFEDNRLRGTPGQFAYIRNLDAQPGQHLAIVRPTHAFRSFGSRDDGDFEKVAHVLDSNVAMVRGPWKEFTRGDGHFGKGDPLGIEVQVVGEVRVQRTGDPATVLIHSSSREIRAGDRLLPMDDAPYDATYFPHAPASVPDDMRVIAFADAIDSAGSMQVVALSAGSSDGVANGNTYTVFQPGAVINDEMTSNSRLFADKVQLPEEYVGHVMVFRTFDEVSYGLIMDGIRPVQLGDRLRMPE